MSFIKQTRNKNLPKVFGILLIHIMLSLTLLSTITLDTSALMEEKDSRVISKEYSETLPFPNEVQIQADEVTELTKVGQWDENLGNQYDICVDGDYLYTLGLMAEINKYDISQPDNPIYLGNYKINNPFISMFTVKNDTMYIESLSYFIRIYNVSDINQVEELSVIEGYFSADHLTIENDVLISGYRNNTIVLYNVSNPFSPILLSTIAFGDTDEQSQELVVHENILYISNASSDIIIYNITQPNAPEFIVSYDNPFLHYNDDIQIYENCLYTRSKYFGIRFFNVTDVYHLEVISSINITTGAIFDCKIIEDILYLFSYSNLTLYDITDIANPIYLSTYSEIIEVITVHIATNLLYILAEDYLKLKILDVDDSDLPQLISTIHFGGFTIDVSVEGNLAVIANNVDGAVILDITNKSEPKILSRIVSPYVTRVLLKDNFLYLLSNHHTLEIYNIADVNNPSSIGSYERVLSWESFYDLVLDGNYVVLMLYSGGIQIIDVTNHSTPTKVNEYLASPSFSCKELLLDNGLLYLLGFGPPGNIVIIDVSDYLNLEVVSVLSITSFEGSHIFIENNFLYVLGYSYLDDLDYLYYYKIKSNGTYKQKGNYAIGDYYCKDLVVADNYVYISTSLYGIVVFRKSTSSIFDLYIESNDMVSSQRMMILDDYIFLAGGFNGLVIYEELVSYFVLETLFIILGCVIGLTIIIVAIVLFLKRRKRKALTKS